MVQLKSQPPFTFAVLLLLAFSVIVPGCRKSSDHSPTPAPPTTNLEIVTPPPTPEVIIDIVTLTPTPTTVRPPQVTLEIATLTPTPQLPTDTGFAYLHNLAGGDAPHLLDSYATSASFDDGDTAWTYDNALVLLAFLARGTDRDLAAARHLADALVYAQTHDAEFDDGRLRDAYHADDFIRADDYVNIDQSGSASGNMAWATLALVRAWEKFGDDTYLEAAERLGQWIVDNTFDERGPGGYTGGLAAGGSQHRWKATEHNADVYAAFMNLYQASGDPVWRERAMSAKRFLLAMWNEEGGFFWTGTTNDGETINPSPIPEDTQSWTLMVLGEPERYGRGLNWAESTLYYQECPVCEAIGGYRFSDIGSGCWPEGTAHMALAWGAAGDPDRAEALIEDLRTVRLPVPDLAGEAIPAACGEDAVTGFGWAYPAGVPHIGATAWYLLAELGYNPFWGTSTAEPVPFAGLYDEQVTGTDISPSQPAPPGLQKGMSYAAWWQGAYSAPEADQALAELAATGADWLALIVTCYQETYLDTEITCELPRTPSDDDLVHAIQTAHQLGLKVMLKPHIDLNHDSNRWRGDISTGFVREAEWGAWFDAYQAVIIHYARLAQAQEVEQYSVGTELVGTSHREADWRRVIDAVRAEYEGPLVYASNHGGEEVRITWWDALDCIGVDAYYPLTTENDPTVAELKVAWEGPIATMERLHERYGKPIIVTEIGYRSVDGANRQPWEWGAPGKVDVGEQADCYQAALESLWGQPWLAGIYWWNWDTNPEQGGPTDTGFTPHDKPAESVLKTFYISEESEP